MIILGNRYTFSETEIKRLKKNFNEINYIRYNNKAANRTIKRINNLIKEKNKTLIVLNTKYKLPKKLIDYLSKLEDKGVNYLTIEEFLEKYLQKYLIEDKKIEDKKTKLDLDSYTKREYFIKRVIDFIGVFFLLIPTLLALIYSKYRIKKESPGPLFYSQIRVGKDEKPFRCVKIRSMYLDAELNGSKFASKDDPRCYPWGKKVRDSKIDELTQIWNVIKGEMHLVGPRPERPIWVKEFKRAIPSYSQRHVVAPGITGLAQIKYQYGAGKLDAEQKLMYDLYYIKNWSLKLELEIIYKTAIFVLTKKREDLSNF